jgi:hypothetical protein
MRYACLVVLLGVFMAVPHIPAAAADSTSSTLVVTAREDTFELSVPVSRLTLAFPRGDLAAVEQPRTGATASPRYFQFFDRRHGLVVSGWIEPASSWDGLEKFWQGELLAMKKIGVQIRQAPEVIVAEPWQAVAYDVDLPKGTSANVCAELVRAGTWVDIHISVTSNESALVAREHAVTFLKSVLIRERQ